MYLYRTARTSLAALVLFVAAALLGGSAASAQDSAQGSLRYESQPDVAALYLGDLAYLMDSFTLPAGLEVEIVLPASAFPDSLIILEGGQRVRTFRYQGGSGSPLTLTWTPPQGADAERQIELHYLATGAFWQPVYDMDVLAEDSVRFNFEAQIQSHALALDGADLRLVAGMPGADPNFQPNINITQSNIGYANTPNTAAPIGGAVQIQYVYEIGPQTIRPGETLRWGLVNETLPARQLLVWDARLGQRVDVIYKVQNDSDVPFVEGTVRIYQNGLFIGDDGIEWTPRGSEGSLTAAGLSDIRVRRTESVTDVGSFVDERYRHDVTLSISNFAGDAIALTVLDQWNISGREFQFSHEPVRQGNNVLRWELDIDAGDEVEIVYTFWID